MTSNGDIYIDDGERNGRVLKWIVKANILVTVMNVQSSCYGLFVDTNDTLYCSMRDHDQVVKRSLNDPEMTSIIVAAGTGSPGSAFNELNQPLGIFVDVNLDLYVADCRNNRVQLFRSGESNGITVAGCVCIHWSIFDVVISDESYSHIIKQFIISYIVATEEFFSKIFQKYSLSVYYSLFSDIHKNRT